ncbi:MAG: H(+)/Cl(-) exchange transporter ClcA [Candidatus Omnitrophica bacterium]|nr:H(+)/Cl(-) exchange transporter ClcA [Candidatus Omnitrophota bacterium]
MKFGFSPAQRVYEKLMHHRYGLSMAIYILAAILTGAGCVLFMRSFEWVYAHRITPDRSGDWAWVTTPLLFLLSIEIIRRISPLADGAGIPQTISAARHLDEKTFARLYPLVSFRTLWVKVSAILLGLWAGASTGREGPTVHIAACLFFSLTLILHRLCRIPFNMRSAVIAGGSAGLAAAFNTPLAGVTFAIEELSSDYFSSIKEMVLMAIIIAGLAAKTLTGDYVYFGRLASPEEVGVPAVLSVSLLCGLMGAVFSTLLIWGRRRTAALRGAWRVAVVVLLSWVLLALISSGMDGIAGPGNIAAQRYVRGHLDQHPLTFFATKITATLCTYWSGIAGGIFAPCLSMGSGLGAWVGSILQQPVAMCGIMGMAAFLAAAIQAPITAFVIIYEMTGHHAALLPVMLASLLGYMTSRALRTPHLYRTLAELYDGQR